MVLGSDLSKDGDESITFCLRLPCYRPEGLKVVVMTPELAGYPDRAQHLCCAETAVDSDTEAVLAEIAS